MATPDAAARVPSVSDGSPVSAAIRSGPRRAPVPVAAGFAALWAAVASFLPVLVLALLAQAGTGSSAGAVLRFAASGWLLGHGVPVTIGPDTISLVPLLVTALAVWRLIRAGVHTSRAVSGYQARSVRGAVVAAVCVGLAYAAVGAIVAIWVDTSVRRASATLGLLAALAAGVGALGYSRAGRALVRRLPIVVRDGLRTGVSAGALVIGVGAAAVGASLALHGSDATQMLSSYRTGLAGQAGITLLCLAYAPNLAVWGAAYLLGPGFAVGLGTVVSPGLVAVGPIPTIPVLASLPLTAVSGPGTTMLGVPLLAAMVAGALFARARVAAGWPRLLAGAALSGPVAAVLLGLAGVVAGGALGSGRLTTIGPSGWSVGLWGGLVVTVGAVVGASAVRAMHRPPADPTGPVRVDG